MNKFLSLSDSQRKTVFEQTATQKKLPVVAIEKDFWVTETLNILFTLPYADKMVFKGGTSLSKVWGVIHRFSASYFKRHACGNQHGCCRKNLLGESISFV